jgi:hypothetical protein
MKFTIPALGIGLAIAAPAFGQMGASMESTPAPATAAKPAAPPGPKISPSKAALKAIIELQTAVNAKDAANIPAKVAAAQAVAKSKEDNYLIAVFQRQAALDAQDNAALATAVGGIVGSGLVDTTQTAALYMDLGIKQFNAKQYPLAIDSRRDKSRRTRCFGPRFSRPMMASRRPLSNSAGNGLRLIHRLTAGATGSSSIAIC